MKIRGWVHIVHRGRKGEVLSVRSGPNLVTSVGEDLYAAICETTGSTRPSHMAVGTGVTAVDKSQTALQGTEKDRVAFSSTVRTGNDLAYNATHSNTSGSSWAIKEAGIFNAAAAGTMLARFLTQTIDVADQESIEITWTVTFGGD
jgi:hypothetical protein